MPDQNSLPFPDPTPSPMPAAPADPGPQPPVEPSPRRPHETAGKRPLWARLLGGILNPWLQLRLEPPDAADHLGGHAICYVLED